MSGKELRLTNEEFDTLRLVVEFAADDLRVTEGSITPGMLGVERVIHWWIGLHDVAALQQAITERTVDANVPLAIGDRSGRQGRTVAGRSTQHEGEVHAGEVEDLPGVGS